MSVNPPPSETELDPGVARLRQRLRALRSRYPGLAVATQVTHIHEDQVVVRASLTLADGTSISAHAAEPSNAGLLDEAIEQAEWRSLTRALDLLGVGDVVASPRRSEPVDEPTPPPAAERPPEDGTPSVVEALRRGMTRRPAPIAEPEPAPSTPQPEPSAPVEAPRRAPVIAAPARPVETAVVENPPADDGEPDMADFNWTHFWTWARAHDMSTKGQVEQRIGRAIDGLTPAEVRQLLHQAGVPLSQ